MCRQTHGAAADDAHEKAEHEDGLFKALVSASVPRMGPRMAVTTVTMELA